MKANKAEIRAMAHAAAAMLFTDYHGTVAKRLVVEEKGKTLKGTGYSETALAEVIQHVIEKFAE